MIRKYDEDLFEGTKMTFGEHLEELRVCLIRAILGIAVGMIVGMALGRPVVKWVKRPVETAIHEYYQTRSENRLNDQYGQMPAETASTLRQRNLIYQDVWIEAEELDRLTALRAELMSGTGGGSPPSSTATRDGASSSGDASAPEVPAPSDAATPAAPTAPVESTQPAEPATRDTATRSVQAEATSIPDKDAAEPTLAGGGESQLAAPDRLSNPGPPSLKMWRTRIWTEPQARTAALSMYEPFMIWLKASLIVGVALASPWIFYQIWLFVAAGLYPHEKNYIYIYLPISLALFIGGILLAYYGVFPPVLSFLLQFNASLGIDPEPRINDWIGFALLLPLGFGFSFQLPLVMLFLERLGILSIALYRQHWRIAVLVICFLAMILTPAEPISMIMMAVPLCFLYFFGLGLCAWMPRHSSPFGPGHEPE